MIYDWKYFFLYLENIVLEHLVVCDKKNNKFVNLKQLFINLEKNCKRIIYIRNKIANEEFTLKIKLQMINLHGK